MDRKKQARHLWEMSFDDDPSFTEFYFQKRYTDDNTISIDEDGIMLSVMQMLPYPFSILGQQVNSGYVSGACTDPEQRNRGLMHQLLKKSLYYLLHRDISICTLIPAHDWLFNYYSKSGFETIFYNKKIEGNIPQWTEKDTQYQLDIFHDFDSKSYNYLLQMWSMMNAAILHPKEDFKIVLADLINAGGAIFTVSDKDKVVGVALAFYYKEERAIYINEIFTDASDIERFLLNHIGKTYNCNKYIKLQNENDQDGNPFGMLRIVQPIKILNLFAQKEPTFKLHIKLIDEQIEENNGYYDVSAGKVKFSKERSSSAETYQELSINKLAKKLFIPLAPYMSLMLD